MKILVCFLKKKMSDSFVIFKDHLKTLHRFLTVNGYETNRVYPEGMSKEEFFKQLETDFKTHTEILEMIPRVEDLRIHMSGVYNHKTLNRRIFVYFCPLMDSNISQKVSEFLRILFLIKDCKHGVIITDRNLSATAKNNINTVKMPDEGNDNDVYNLYHFTDKTFIDISDNYYTPNVRRVFNTEEAKIFCRENNINGVKLPKISVDDPLAAFYLCKVGNIIELERDVGLEHSIMSTQLVYRYVTPISFNSRR